VGAGAGVEVEPLETGVAPYLLANVLLGVVVYPTPGIL